MSTEGLPSVCKEIISAVIRKDPNLEQEESQKIVTIALDGGIALDLVLYIAWNPSEFRQSSMDFTKVVEFDLEQVKFFSMTHA